MTNAPVVCVLVGLALSGLASVAHASGFALKEQSGSALGGAFAGVSAEAQDASYSFYNPASLAALDQPQGVVVGSALIPRFRPDDMRAATAEGTSITGGDGTTDAAVDAAVPAAYASAPLSETVTFGFALNAPFGLATEYNDAWTGRYHALDSELQTVNVNPMLTYQATDWLAVGGGPQAQYVNARLTSAIDFGALGARPDGKGGQLVPFARPTRQDGKAELEGGDWGIGFNVGILLTPRDGTKIGLGYRSRVKHELDVDADFTLDSAGVGRLLRTTSGAFRDTGASASLTTPDSASFGVAQRLSAQWTVLGEVQWTNWSTFDELRIRFDNPNQPDTVTEEDWHDTMFAAVGARYQPSSNLSLRAGVAYDQSPIPERTRTPRIPGGDRTWLAVGAQYTPLTGVTLDVGYAHIFVEDTAVDLDADQPGNASRGDLEGTYENGIDLITVQATVTF